MACRPPKASSLLSANHSECGSISCSIAPFRPALSKWNPNGMSPQPGARDTSPWPRKSPAKCSCDWLASCHTQRIRAIRPLCQQIHLEIRPLLIRHSSKWWLLPALSSPNSTTLSRSPMLSNKAPRWTPSTPDAHKFPLPSDCLWCLR